MSTELNRIAGKAKADRNIKFTSLVHLLTPDFLIETWGTMNCHGASGIDMRTIDDYGKDLSNNVKNLCERLKSNRYIAPPVRRVEIPKPGKGNKTRPLGIPTVEDRLLQKSVARILEAIFEQDFLDVSFGFRPKRSPHMALRALRSHITVGQVMQIFEADIRGYFNNINHQWLMKMLKHRISDPGVLRLIGKWLNAGVMLNGIVVRAESGTPQGGPISCILSNIYLHYVLDLWFERKFKLGCKGKAFLVRFVDDFVVCFQYKSDLLSFETAIGSRMTMFGLELVPEKTQSFNFGRFARERQRKYGAKTGNFIFLGFEHVCGMDRAKNFALIRIPSRKSCRKFLDCVHEWLRTHSHWRRRDQQRHLSAMLRGFYQYFFLNHCKERLKWVFKEVQLQWIRKLRRRSQRHRLYWSYLLNTDWFRLPEPPTAVIHPGI